MSYPTMEQCEEKYPANGHVYRVKNRTTGVYHSFDGLDGRKAKTTVRPWAYWVCGYLKGKNGGDWTPVRVVEKKAKPKQEMCHIVSGLRVYCEVHGVGWWGFDGSAHARAMPKDEAAAVVQAIKESTSWGRVCYLRPFP